MLSTSGIYEIRNTLTGHCYIGSSVNMQTRKRVHFLQLRKGEHHSQYLQRAFDKYGEDAFEFHVIERVPEKEMLIQREQHWIETRHPKYNMNPMATNRLGAKASEATIAKMRAYALRPEVIAKKKAELTGHPVAPETIEKIKAARAKQPTTEGMLKGLEVGWNLPAEKRVTRKGQTNSEEHNRKIAAAHTGREATPEAKKKMRQAKLGKKQSEEHIQKRAEANRGREVSADTRKRIAETNRTTWAKKSPEERHSYTQKRPPVTEETRARLRESHLGQKSTPEANAKRVASLQNKTEEEKRIIREKKQAAWAKRREASQPKLPGM